MAYGGANVVYDTRGLLQLWGVCVCIPGYLQDGLMLNDPAMFGFV